MFLTFPMVNEDTLITERLVASLTVQRILLFIRVEDPVANTFPAVKGCLLPFFSESLVEIFFDVTKNCKGLSFLVKIADVLSQ